MEVHNIVQEAGIQTIPQNKKCKKANWLSEETLQISGKRREAEGKREKEGYIYLNTEFQRIARRNKKAVNTKKQRKTFEQEKLEIPSKNYRHKLSEHCAKLSEHCAKMDKIKDNNGRDLTEAEDINKRWQEYTE